MSVSAVHSVSCSQRKQGLLHFPVHGAVKAGIQPVAEEGTVRKRDRLWDLRLPVLPVPALDFPPAIRRRDQLRQLLCAGSVRMLFVKRQNFPNKVLSAPLNMVFHVLFSKLAIPQGPLEIRAVEKGFRLLPGPVLRSAG